MESFRKWLAKQKLPAQEACTDTGDVAYFARPVIPAYVKMYPKPVMMDEKKKKSTHIK